MGTRTNEGTVAMHACNEALRCNCGAADTRVSKAAAWLPSLVGPLARIREQSRWGILNSYWPGHTGRPLGAGRFIGGYTRIWGRSGARGEKRDRCWQRSGGGRPRRHLQLDNWNGGGRAKLVLAVPCGRPTFYKESARGEVGARVFRWDRSRRPTLSIAEVMGE